MPARFPAMVRGPGGEHPRTNKRIRAPGQGVSERHLPKRLLKRFPGGPAVLKRFCRQIARGPAFAETKSDAVGVDRETLRTKRGSPTRRRDARAGSATEMPRPEPHDNMGIRDPVAVPAGGVLGVPGPGAVTVRTPAPRRDVPGPPGGRRVEIHVRNAVCLDGFGARRDPDPPAIGQVDPLARGIVLDVGDGGVDCVWS
jgi:hypothetical protein